MSLFVTANLGRHVDTAEFLNNVRSIDDEAGAGAVVGFQEIDEDDEPDEHHGLRLVLDDFTFAGWETREPIAFGSNWTILEENIHRGIPGTKRLSPARPIVEAVAEHRSGALIAFLDLHYPRNTPKLEAGWRALREIHRSRQQHYLDRGITSVWMSDVNRGVFAKLHHDEWTVAHHGYDWVKCLEAPGGAQVTPVSVGCIPLTIDPHDAQWGRVRLKH